MSITTSQQITKYYDLFRSFDVTFSKEVIRATGLLPQHVHLKCMGEQWPCVLYTTSLQGAKIIASVKPALFDKIRKANNLISLRFSFRDPGKNDPVTFFVAAKVTGFAPYNRGAGDLQAMTLQYTQRPPDPLIEILGRLLEANVNSSRRREDRILITRDSVRRLGLLTKDTVLTVQGVPRKCILRDISFTGVKVIIVGIAKFLVSKPCTVRIEIDDPRSTFDIRGSIVRSEPVEGRKDLAAVAIEFDPAAVPMTFKMHLNDYLSQYKKLADAQDAHQAEAVKAAAKAAESSTTSRTSAARPAAAPAPTSTVSAHASAESARSAGATPAREAARPSPARPSAGARPSREASADDAAELEELPSVDDEGPAPQPPRRAAPPAREKEHG